jgi:hypothetical protein
MKFTKEARERLPRGPEQGDMLRKARQADTAFQVDDWINSLEMQPPK